MCSPVCSLYPPVLTPLSDSPHRGNKSRLSITPPSPPPNLTHRVCVSYQHQNRIREWKGCANGQKRNGCHRMELMFAGENQRGMEKNDPERDDEK